MAIETHAQDKVISVIAGNKTLLTSVIFSAERATAICTYGLLGQLRQGIVVPETGENITSNEVLMTEQVNVLNKHMQECASHYTTGSTNIKADSKDEPSSISKYEYGRISMKIFDNCQFQYTDARKIWHTLFWKHMSHPTQNIYQFKCAVGRNAHTILELHIKYDTQPGNKRTILPLQCAYSSTYNTKTNKQTNN